MQLQLKKFFFYPSFKTQKCCGFSVKTFATPSPNPLQIGPSHWVLQESTTIFYHTYLCVFGSSAKLWTHWRLHFCIQSLGQGFPRERQLKNIYRRGTDGIGPSELSLGQEKPVNNRNHMISAPWPILSGGSLPKDRLRNANLFPCLALFCIWHTVPIPPHFCHLE